MAADEAVHLSPESLEEYFTLGVVSAFSLSKDVEARLEIDPPSDQLRLYIPASGAPPDVTDFARIKVDRVDVPGDKSQYRLIFDANRMHYAAYQLIESVVAYVRDGTNFSQAVIDSIADMKHLLSNRGRLSDEEVTGLWGELLMLEHVVDKYGEEAAMEAWIGPAASEHDFAFEGFEAEVKTTLGESRRHHISSDTQLEISPNRPLFLVSIQATLAGGAGPGRTLPRLVRDVRARLSVNASRFDAALLAVGYLDVDSDLYRIEFQLRSTPRAYLIDRDFPAVTRSRLAQTIPNLQLISDVRFRVDVSTLAHVAGPPPLDNFCEDTK